MIHEGVDRNNMVAFVRIGHRDEQTTSIYMALSQINNVESFVHVVQHVSKMGCWDAAVTITLTHAHSILKQLPIGCGVLSMQGTLSFSVSIR